MTRFIEGGHRQQSILLSERIEDYIPEENPIRVIGTFVDKLNLYD